MYVQLITGKAKWDKRKEFYTLWNREMSSVLRRRAGFIDATPLFDENQPYVFIHLQVWNTIEDGERYRHDSLPCLVEALQSLSQGPITIRGFEAEFEPFPPPSHKAA